MTRQPDNHVDVATIIKNYRRFADALWSEVTDRVHTVEEYHEALERLTKDYVSQIDQYYADFYSNKVPEITGETSDGYHTFNELYRFRLLYNAAFFNLLPNTMNAVKSWKHSDGEPCFGGGWFVVTVELPSGQITNHYEAKDWDLFQIREADKAPEWDGHTPQDVEKRLTQYITAQFDNRSKK